MDGGGAARRSRRVCLFRVVRVPHSVSVGVGRQCGHVEADQAKDSVVFFFLLQGLDHGPVYRYNYTGPGTDCFWLP